VVELGDPVQDPPIVRRIGVIIRHRHFVDGAHLPGRAQVQQLGVERQEGLVGCCHAGPAAGGLQLAGDAPGVLGAALVGEAPSGERWGSAGHQPVHGEVDQVGLGVGLGETGRVGHPGQFGEADAAQRVQNEQLGHVLPPVATA
jgi:hypothetical protein